MTPLFRYLTPPLTLVRRVGHIVRVLPSRTLHCTFKMSCVSPIKRVGILGGTHGNELSGVYLVKKWLKDKSPVTRGTFETTVCISNPKAVEKCVRYIDTDLNRVFTDDNLRCDGQNSVYELNRGKELNRIFGPKHSPESYDFIVDFHNTTSNMHNSLMVHDTEDPVVMNLVNYVLQNYKHSHNYVFITGNAYHTTRTMATHGLGIEIGPQAHGTLDADVYQRMEKITHYVLDFLDKFNQGEEFPACSVEAHQIIEKIDFPRDESGDLTAMIHPKLQNKDWHPINPGDPIFLTFDGETICYQGNSTIYPAFINEAAYYEKRLAFWAMKKIQVSVPPLKVQK